jgi:hypothetical protein
VLALLIKRRRVADARPESRVYLQLRRAYQRAGFESSANEAPMHFVERLERAHAPGGSDARRAVELYLRSRFGGEDLGAEGQRQLRAAAHAARRALRAA